MIYEFLVNMSLGAEMTYSSVHFPFMISIFLSMIKFMDIMVGLRNPKKWNGSQNLDRSFIFRSKMDTRLKTKVFVQCVLPVMGPSRGCPSEQWKEECSEYRCEIKIQKIGSVKTPK